MPRPFEPLKLRLPIVAARLSDVGIGGRAGGWGWVGWPAAAKKDYDQLGPWALRPPPATAGVAEPEAPEVVAVRRWRRVRGQGWLSRPHTEYVVESTTVGHRHQEVSRRFNDFLRLDAFVQRFAAPAAPLPMPLASDGLTKDKNDPALVRYRAAALEAFLQV